MTAGLAQSVTAYRMLGLRYGHSMSFLNNRILNLGYSYLMFSCIEEVINFVSCLYHGKVVLLFPPFGLGYIKHMKNKQANSVFTGLPS